MINEKYLPFLTEMRGIVTELEGEQVLVGLTATETAEYFLLVERRDAGEQGFDDRWLELHDKHEQARHRIILAEAELRTD
jgi:hypothetical protein